MDAMRVMHDLAYRVREYVPGPVEWIAKQNDPERDDVFGFAIGRGFASVTLEAAENADDTLVRSLAAQILGFEVDSPQDLERRRDEAAARIKEMDQQIADGRRWRSYWEEKRIEAVTKLDAGASADPSNVQRLEEFFVRIGEDSPYAATLRCIPIETDDDLQWQGIMEFDDNALNFPTEFPDYDGKRTFTIYDHWVYPREVASGAYMMSLLDGWWKDITALFERVKAVTA